jgi:hypothetical protein
VARLPDREGETPRFAGRILTLEGEDKERLERWLCDDRTALKTAEVTDSPNATDDLDDLVFLNLNPSVVSTPTRSTSHVARPAAPYTPRQEPVEDPVEASVSEVPVPSARPDPEPLVGVSEPKPKPLPEPELEPELISAPRFRFDFGRSTVSVSWLDQAGFGGTWEQELTNGSLQIPAPPGQLPYLHQAFTVSLVPPGRRAISLRAGVVAHLPEGFGLGLELTAFLRNRLEDLAAAARAGDLGDDLASIGSGPPSDAPDLAPVRADPDFSVDLAAGLGAVVFRTERTVREALDAGMADQGQVFETPPPHPPLYTRLDVALALPQGNGPKVRGTVVGHGPLGFEVRLALSPDTRAQLIASVSH